MKKTKAEFVLVCVLLPFRPFMKKVEPHYYSPFRISVGGVGHLCLSTMAAKNIAVAKPPAKADTSTLPKTA